MFAGLGVNWAATLLGCVAAILVPIPIVFYIYGHKIRERSAFAPTKPSDFQAQPAEDATATGSNPPQTEKVSTRRTMGENAV
jgi:DHA1 family multidrug resistance protein-like MFS transporter